MKIIKILESGKDFTKSFWAGNLSINDKVFVKSQAVSGWAKVGKVIRIMKSQLEIEVTDFIPTKDVARIGTKNPFVDERKNGGFFEDWALSRKMCKGDKIKFFIDSGIEVGSTNEWNSRCLAISTEMEEAFLRKSNLL